MTWDELAIDLLKAAKKLRDLHPRSSASRAYYAAHVALAKELIAHGYVPARRRSTQPHDAQRRLIGFHLNHLGNRRIRDLRAIFARLYAMRVDSDYVRTAQVNSRTAMDALRDASSALFLLDTPEAV